MLTNCFPPKIRNKSIMSIFTSLIQPITTICSQHIEATKGNKSIQIKNAKIKYSLFTDESNKWSPVKCQLRKSTYKTIHFCILRKRKTKLGNNIIFETLQKLNVFMNTSNKTWTGDVCKKQTFRWEKSMKI
jgi:hypothetical protein